MKYRTKIYVFLIAIALTSSFIALGIIYYETRNRLLQQIQSQLLSIATTTSALIDEKLLLQLHTPVDEKSAAYQTLKSDLQKVQKANQLHNILVAFVYIMKPDPENPDQLIYLVDSDESVEQKHIGEVEPLSQAIGLLKENNLEKTYIPPHFITSSYGTWLSGFAPIRDKNGNYIASLGVELRANDVFHMMFQLLAYEFWALAGSMLAAVFGSFFLANRATKSLNQLCDTVHIIGQGDLTARVALTHEDEFGVLGKAINTMAKGLEEREHMKMNFAHYVSSHVMEHILTSKTPLKLEGERKKITLLFSDIREFTTLAEKHPAELIVNLLNEYFEKMINVIFQNRGTLDKFLGDGLMVEFGAPLEDPLEEKHALITALEMQRELKKLCIKWEKEGNLLSKLA